MLDGRRLFAVNPGSDSISSFRVSGHGLELIDTDPSGGDQPISLTVHDGLLYVLNAGGAGDITGHRISRHGDLSPLVGSTRPLSGAGAGPAQVSFDPSGETLVVTEKNTNLIDTYEVDGDTGLASGPSPQASAGATPFGFAFDGRGHLIVSEAFGGAPDQSAVSSYAVDDGLIDAISPSVGDDRDGRVLDRGDQERALRVYDQHRQRLDLGLPHQPRRARSPCSTPTARPGSPARARSTWR